MAGVGESILGATVESVVEKVASHAIQHVAAILGFKEDLNKMKTTLQEIKSFLADAERQVEINGNVVRKKEWLAEFKSITYEADDMLDELEYKWLKQEVEGHTQVRKKFSSLMTKCKYSRRIRATQKKLDRISALADQYRLQKLNVRAGGNLEIAQERVTTSLMGDEKVIGRDDEKAQVIEQLMSAHEGVQVLTIYGIGGVGKTSLARYIYNDSKVIQKHFELKIWVCVSDNFDVKRLTSEILDSVVIQFKESSTRPSSEYISLDELQKALREKLISKNFLLVLDDVWNEDQQKWEEFKKPFVIAEEGKSKNKILVTTRPRKIGTMMSSILKPIELEGLSRDDFWNLFKRHAFDESSSGSNQETLEEIGKEIVQKLKGVPLAAKTVGRLLKSDMSVGHWNDILNSELWKSSEGKDDIMPALRLSYQHLTGALKPCFAFLCLFPKDHVYEERKVKQLWIANGFICLQGSKLLEDIATTYINTLLSMCMIQVGHSERKFVVHDLLHDLAQMVSKDEYFHIRGDADLKNIPDNVRHLNISSEITSSKLNNFKSTFKNLRNLIVSESFNDKDLHGICTKAKHLRALVISGSGVTESLSKCHFKHLRYLDLSYTDISCLPDSLCTFYNLQVLNVKRCQHLNKFPVEIVKLVNLQHIYTKHAGVSTSSIKNVVNLTSLQELCFHVSKVTGRTVTELENMNNIRELEIQYLENVSSKEEAIRARLNKKNHLVSLILKWSSEIRDDIPCDEILCGLQPYKYLRILEIYNYNGAEFPPWEEKNGNRSLPILQKFVLRRCFNLHTLKFLEHPELQYHEISDCPKLKEISFCKSPKLLRLQMSSCEELTLSSGFEDFDSLEYLETWILPSSLKKLIIRVGPNPSSFTHDELVAFMSKSFENLTSLVRLEIKGLPHITELKAAEVWQNMTSLEYLDISDWMNLMSILDFGLLPSLNWLYIKDCSNLESLPADLNQLSSLETLWIWDCPKIKSLPNDGFPPSLQILYILYCSNLESLPADLNQLSSLEILNIEGCPKINSLPNDVLPPSLDWLSIKDCSNLESLPADLNQLSSLKSLNIVGCLKINSLPANGLPPSLIELFIKDCSNLESLLVDLNQLSSLKSLNIVGCLKINSLPANGLPPSLIELFIKDCSNLESLPADLNQLYSLKRLEIAGCPKIKSLPNDGLPPSLPYLSISECPLLKESCQKDVGSDWPKISNIPEVRIDGRRP